MAFRLRASYGCGVELTLDIIGKKWMALILAHIKQGAKHYADLRTLIPRVSEKMLTERLADLVAAGLVDRKVRGQRVRYELSSRGARLRPALDALHDWGVWLAKQEGIDLGASD